MVLVNPFLRFTKTADFLLKFPVLRAMVPKWLLIAEIGTKKDHDSQGLVAQNTLRRNAVGWKRNFQYAIFVLEFAGPLVSKRGFDPQDASVFDRYAASIRSLLGMFRFSFKTKFGKEKNLKTSTRDAEYAAGRYFDAQRNAKETQRVRATKSQGRDRILRRFSARKSDSFVHILGRFPYWIAQKIWRKKNPLEKIQSLKTKLLSSSPSRKSALIIRGARGYPCRASRWKKTHFCANFGRWKTLKICWKVPVKYF